MKPVQASRVLNAAPNDVLAALGDPRAHSLLPRVLNPLMKPKFRRSLLQHLDALEAHFDGSTKA